MRALAAALLVLPVAAAAQSAGDTDTRAVAAVLAEYKAAIERLDAAGTERLFLSNSTIFETGAAEGSYATHLSHHLGPELAAFQSFRFSDYKVEIRLKVPWRWRRRPIATGSYPR